MCVEKNSRFLTFNIMCWKMSVVCIQNIFGHNICITPQPIDNTNNL